MLALGVCREFHFALGGYDGLNPREESRSCVAQLQSPLIQVLSAIVDLSLDCKYKCFTVLAQINSSLPIISILPHSLLS